MGDRARADRGVSQAELEHMRASWRERVPEGADIVLEPEPLERDKRHWRETLSEERYHILFQEGTERPNSSPLNDEHRDGVFVCAACSLALFTTPMKFESGTGWPSFFTHIPGHLDTKRDYKLIWPRTEYHCARCGGHQGHVFDDGPPPTGQRWCNNGLALRFVPTSG